MKPVLVTLTFLLFAFPLAFSNDVLQPVLDRDGNPVVPGGEYFIEPSLLGPVHPGVVTLGKTGHSTVPATVEVYFGLYAAKPVKLVPLANTDEIFTDTQLEIEFTKERANVESPKWAVVVGSDIRQTYVGIGGPEDHPGQQVYSGKFKILKSYYNMYSLAFCLSMIVDGSPVCWGVDLHFTAKDVSLLVLTNGEPGFLFGLKKAEPYPGIKTVV